MVIIIRVYFLGEFSFYFVFFSSNIVFHNNFYSLSLSCYRCASVICLSGMEHKQLVDSTARLCMCVCVEFQENNKNLHYI